jgi:hypothetical protein
MVSATTQRTPSSWSWTRRYRLRASWVASTHTTAAAGGLAVQAERDVERDLLVGRAGDQAVGARHVDQLEVGVPAQRRRRGDRR